MDWVRAYLLSVTAASIICSIILALLGKNEKHTVVLKTICGIYMLITVAAPFARFNYSQMDILPSFCNEAQLAIDEGVSYANDEMARYIKESVASYIFERGQSMGANIEVDVSLDSLTPGAVVITGAVSPFVKNELSVWIEENLGIPLEAQQWE